MQRSSIAWTLEHRADHRRLHTHLREHGECFPTVFDPSHYVSSSRRLLSTSTPHSHHLRSAPPVTVGERKTLSSTYRWIQTEIQFLMDRLNLSSFRFQSDLANLDLRNPTWLLHTFPFHSATPQLHRQRPSCISEPDLTAFIRAEKLHSASLLIKPAGFPFVIPSHSSKIVLKQPTRAKQSDMRSAVEPCKGSKKPSRIPTKVFKTEKQMLE